MIVAILIALPLGLLIGHTGRGVFLVVGLANGLRAIPTLGFVVLLFIWLSSSITTTFEIPYIVDRGALASFVPMMIVLVLLAMPPILTNTYAGVQNVEPAVRDAARGMGMTGGQIVRKVELPCALPLILSGIRSATLQVIATATVAAYLPFLGGLGRLIKDGAASSRTRSTATPRWSAPAWWSRCSRSSSTGCSTSSSATRCPPGSPGGSRPGRARRTRRPPRPNPRWRRS